MQVIIFLDIFAEKINFFYLEQFCVHNVSGRHMLSFVYLETSHYDCSVNYNDKIRTLYLWIDVEELDMYSGSPALLITTFLWVLKIAFLFLQKKRRHETNNTKICHNPTNWSLKIFRVKMFSSIKPLLQHLAPYLLVGREHAPACAWC